MKQRSQLDHYEINLLTFGFQRSTESESSPSHAVDCRTRGGRVSLTKRAVRAGMDGWKDAPWCQSCEGS